MVTGAREGQGAGHGQQGRGRGAWFSSGSGMVSGQHIIPYRLEIFFVEQIFLAKNICAHATGVQYSPWVSLLPGCLPCPQRATWRLRRASHRPRPRRQGARRVAGVAQLRQAPVSACTVRMRVPVIQEMIGRFLLAVRLFLLAVRLFCLVSWAETGRSPSPMCATMLEDSAT